MISRNSVEAIGFSGLSLQRYLSRLCDKEREKKTIYECVREVLEEKLVYSDEFYKDVVQLTVAAFNYDKSIGIAKHLYQYPHFCKHYYLVNILANNSYDKGISARNIRKIRCELFGTYNALKIVPYDGSYNLRINEKEIKSTLEVIKCSESRRTLCIRLGEKTHIGAIFIKDDKYTYKMIEDLNDTVHILEEAIEYDFDLCVVPDYSSYNILGNDLIHTMKEMGLPLIKIIKIVLALTYLDFKYICSKLTGKYKEIEESMSNNNDIRLLDIWEKIFKIECKYKESYINLLLHTYRIIYMGGLSENEIDKALKKLSKAIDRVLSLKGDDFSGEILRCTFLSSTLDETINELDSWYDKEDDDDFEASFEDDFEDLEVSDDDEIDLNVSEEPSSEDDFCIDIELDDDLTLEIPDESGSYEGSEVSFDMDEETDSESDPFSIFNEESLSGKIIEPREIPEEPLSLFGLFNQKKKQSGNQSFSRHID